MWSYIKSWFVCDHDWRPCYDNQAVVSGLDVVSSQYSRCVKCSNLRVNIYGYQTLEEYMEDKNSVEVVTVRIAPPEDEGFWTLTCVDEDRETFDNYTLTDPSGDTIELSRAALLALSTAATVIKVV